MRLTGRSIAIFALFFFVMSGDFQISLSPLLAVDFRVKWATLAFVVITLLVFPGRARMSWTGLNLVFFVTSILALVTVLGSLSWTPSLSDGLRAFEGYAFTLLVVFLGNLCLRRFVEASEAAQTIAKLFLATGLIYSSLIFFIAWTTGGRGSILIGGPNVATRIVFFALMSALYLWALTKNMLYVSLVPILAISVILLGSRGGIVGAVVTGLSFLVLSIGRIRPSLIKATVLVVCGFAVARLSPIWPTVERVFITRVVNLLILTPHTAGRNFFWDQSLTYIGTSPIVGMGLGSHYYLMGHYPHNVFLEVLLNAGLLAFAPFLASVVCALIVLYRARSSPSLPIAILPLYMMIVGSFSGDMHDFRFFFLWSMIACSLMRLTPKTGHLRTHDNSFFCSYSLGCRDDVSSECVRCESGQRP